MLAIAASAQVTEPTKVARVAGLNLQFASPYVCTFELDKASPSD